ncbi:MAG TPA: hypothetical protein VI434_13160 [Candidatus Dormibacteraeota bacterium]
MGADVNRVDIDADEVIALFNPASNQRKGPSHDDRDQGCQCRRDQLPV